jgi:hypothetical protein
MLWNGNECGKREANENFKETFLSADSEEPKTTGE